jgi:hypothetical protein
MSDVSVLTSGSVAIMPLPKSRRPFDPRRNIETYVYRYYDDQDRLLYVGSTSDLAKREAAHLRGSKWFPKVSRREEDLYPHRKLAEDAETEQIRHLMPMYNIKDTGSWRLTCGNSVDARSPGTRYRDNHMGV